VICVSLYILVGPTLIIWLTILLIISFKFLWIGQCPLSAILFPYADMEGFDHWEHIFLFLFYDAVGVADCMASVIGWLANDELENVWKEVLVA